MIVAVDARRVREPLSGVGRYTINLIRGLQLADADDLKKIVLLVPAGPKLALEQENDPRCVVEPVPAHRHILRARTAVQRVLTRHAVDILHTPDAFGPLTSRCRRVTTIHDVIPIRCRRWLNRGAKSRAWPLWLAWLRLQVNRAHHVITVSAFSRQDIIGLLGISEDRISVVYNGIATPVDVQMVGGLRNDAVPGRILYVGRRDPYKNIEGLIRAFAMVRSQVPHATLMVVGTADTRYGGSEELAGRLGLGDSVRFTGYLDETSLHAAYRSAAMFVFPSYYEGFGLPPLEAMAHGVPVVASNRASLPEILGAAAEFVDPADVGAMARAVARVLNNPIVSSELTARGLLQAQKYTLAAQGSGTIEVYRRVLRSG